MRMHTYTHTHTTMQPFTNAPHSLHSQSRFLDFPSIDAGLIDVVGVDSANNFHHLCIQLQTLLTTEAHVQAKAHWMVCLSRNVHV